MAYTSAHTGPEIDAAVEMLAQVQSARDETSENAATVKTLSAEVRSDTVQVAEQSQAVARNSAKVADQTMAVAVDREATQNAAAAALISKASAADDRGLAQQSAGQADASARAASQSQGASVAAAQVVQEAQVFVAQARNDVDAAAIQVESGRAAAQRSAQAAAVSEANAAAVVTGGTASFNPAPGKIPIGSADSKINEDWLPASVARTQRVSEVATQAADAEQLATSLNDKVTTTPGAGKVPQAGVAGVLADEWMPQSLARVSALQAPDGSDEIGYEGGTVKDELDKAKVLLDYVELRAYSGEAMRVTLTRAGIAGDFLRIAAQSGRADNGGTYIIASNGAVWSRVYEGKVYAAWFEGSTDLAIIQRAIDEAIAVGVQEVQVSRQYVCVGALKNRTNVRFVGDGQLSGNASYRVRVIPESAPTTPPKFYDLDPARHLKAFSNARAPVVVLTGSSTGTWNPNTLDTGGGVAAMLSLRIKQLNPEKKITFFNRCIGGQTFANLDGKPSAFPAWYADSSRAWIDYISDVKPDVIYIIMGSNDSAAISSAALTSAVAKMKAFAKVPDLVFITQPSVCADPNDAYASYGSYADQEGRDFAAGLVRSFAIYNGHGLIDGNRMGGIVLDGRDILSTSMKRFASSVDTPAGIYTCPVAAHDFTLNLAFVGDAAANTAAFSLTGNPNNPPFVRVGAGGGSGSSGDIVQIRKDANGFFVFQCYCAGVNYQTINTTIPFPAASFNLEVIKTGVWLTISLDGQQDTTRTTIKLMAHGGEFLPMTRYYALETGPWTRVNHVNLGEPAAYRPQLTSIQAWGAPNPTATTSLPYGGNGLNHFSSLGSTLIYGPLLDGENLRATVYGSGLYTPVMSNLQNLTAAVPRDQLIYNRVGNMVTVAGCITLTPAVESTLTQLQLSIPIPSDFTAVTDAAGFCVGVQEPLMTGVIWSDATADNVLIQFKSTVKVTVQVRISFNYQIK